MVKIKVPVHKIKQDLWKEIGYNVYVSMSVYYLKMIRKSFCIYSRTKWKMSHTPTLGNKTATNAFVVN